MKKKSLLTLLAALLCVANMWADVNADDYKLPGAFSVSATKVVYFSQGNLQYTKSTGKWKIMDHQYDVVETLSQNVGTDYADQDVVTLFGWGTSGWNNTAADATSVHYQPYATCNTNHSTANNNYQYGPSLANVAAGHSWAESDATKNYDWGVFNSGDLGAGWRTLTTAEWGYLFNSRTGAKASTVNGTGNCTYTKATINTDGTPVKGIILFPDGGTFAASEFTAVGSPNSSGVDYTTTCTAAQWTALEGKGCVFLPAAGRRYGSSVYDVGSYGYYWSSSAYSATLAYGLGFGSGSVGPQDYLSRYSGYSVRLVSDEAPVTPATVTAAPTAISGLIYNGSAQALINAGTASGGTLNYSLDNTNWSTSIPTATDAEDYTVYYKVVGDASHTDYTPSPNTVAVTISKADAVITDTPAAIEGLVYTGAAQTLISAGSATGGELQYKVDASAWSTDLPQATAIGDHTVYYKVVGDGNHNGIDEASFTVTISGPTDQVLTANQDPNRTSDYYSTFYHSAIQYSLPEGTQAYIATLDGDALILTKIAEGGEVIPMDNAVILKSNSSAITLTPSDATPVSFTATNNLLGVDAATAAPSNCYVLSGHSSDNSVTGVGFYQFTGTLKAHKAYAVIDAGIAYAPKKLRFVFNQEQTTTDVDQITNDQSPITNKVIEDGVLYIEKNGVRYNAQGQIIK